MGKLLMSHCVFPTNDIERTARFYKEKLGFNPVAYLDSSEPHICLYRDSTEIILTKSKGQKVTPNRILYGYDYDLDIITDRQEELLKEFQSRDVTIVRDLTKTDYQNKEFVIEDLDSRWLGFGMKEPS
jgi:catechol 2,3-dioxygenase-like lactoylglutathione lyase family enzyme